MSEQPNAVQIRNLTKVFRSGETDLHILSGVSLELNRGEAIAITGPSGTGKSTLLYIVGLLDTPTSGEVLFANEQPHQWSDAAQARFRSQNIGFIFQDHHLLPQCTVLENVLVPTLAAAGADDAAEQRARDLLERVGLKDRLQHRPAQLSGGEKQRVAVCRSLINQPLLLLADEPTGNLDPKTADAVGTLLLEVASEQDVVLMCVTHSLELAARFPRHFELTDGKLAESGKK
ncbi:MAG: ABC transporter ATP-binding protein [Planctomycetaceae bacterium]|nr:ABC transporter ATP-binding protein [Planctomycetaceae bacterium]